MRTPMILKLVAAALLLAPVAGAKDVEVAMFLHDDPLHILPAVVNADAGDTLRLQVTNDGQAPHDVFFCGDPGLQAPPMSCARPLGGPVRPDTAQTLPLVVNVPTEPGTYWFYCTIPGHAAGGMAGQLVVAGEPTGTKDAPAPGAVAALAALAVLALLRRARA